MWANLILSSLHSSPYLWIHKYPALQNPASLQLTIPATGGSGTPRNMSPGFLGSQTHQGTFFHCANTFQARVAQTPCIYPEANIMAY